MIVTAGFAFVALVAGLVALHMYEVYTLYSISEEELRRFFEEFPFPPLPWEDGPV
jgi:hypothetical protein